MLGNLAALLMLVAPPAAAPYLRTDPVWLAMVKQPPVPFVDAEKHVCWRGYVGIQTSWMVDVQPYVACETAVGLAEFKEQPQWAAWIAANDPNPVPFPSTP